MHKLLLSLLALGLPARGQCAYDTWYFGNYAALRFTPGGGGSSTQARRLRCRD